jgi:chemotaxis protein CheZ
MPDSNDDFDALFDEISAQRATTAPLVEASSTPDALEVNSVVEKITALPAENIKDKPMYDRLGGIVRLLHNSLHELGYDKTLSMMETDIVNAKDRLEYVATLTEKAANKVLNEIDVGMPALDTLSSKGKSMDARWTALFKGDLSVEEFKVLATESHQFSMEVVRAADEEKARLMEIMMAQDFQDITGQLIKKIVAITCVAEKELAQLLRDNAPIVVNHDVADADKPPVDLLHGPSLVSAALVQDNVDDLLDSLGF